MGLLVALVLSGFPIDHTYLFLSDDHNVIYPTKRTHDGMDMPAWPTALLVEDA